ncbi:MAG: hypothetical protein V7K64_18755 [Nostoc sp.]|uniref:hypothetical protein n=1 Tax=unclassified Nostoc TaxID=2593658 RepID=UPI0025DB3168|nr:hypothetical protein [Nostoc sp. JL34]
MTQKIRFHLDENVSDAIAKGLRRRGSDDYIRNRIDSCIRWRTALFCNVSESGNFHP